MESWLLRNVGFYRSFLLFYQYSKNIVYINQFCYICSYSNFLQNLSHSLLQS